MDSVIEEERDGGRKLFSSSFVSCKEKEMDWEDRERGLDGLLIGSVMIFVWIKPICFPYMEVIIPKTCNSPHQMPKFRSLSGTKKKGVGKNRWRLTDRTNELPGRLGGMEQRELVGVDLHAKGRTGGTLNAGQTLIADRYGQISKRSEEVIMTVMYHSALQKYGLKLPRTW